MPSGRVGLALGVLKKDKVSEKKTNKRKLQNKQNKHNNNATISILNCEIDRVLVEWFGLVCTLVGAWCPEFRTGSPEKHYGRNCRHG